MVHRTFRNILLNSLILFFYIRWKAAVLLIEYKQRNECAASLDSLVLGLRDHRDFTCTIYTLPSRSQDKTPTRDSLIYP